MPGHRDLPGWADQPGRPAPGSRENLRARTEELPDNHPSSPRYRNGRDNSPVNLRALELGGRDRTAGRPAGGPETPNQPGREAGRSGWDSSGVAEHPDKPAPDAIRLGEDRRQHILDGDSWGGGHRHGTGREGKTEFPPDWDDEKIGTVVLDVARHPDQPPVYQEWNSRWIVAGTRSEVEVSAVVQSDGQVWTAWPEEGSPGVIRNPKEGTP